jgi:hypothetical protein
LSGGSTAEVSQIAPSGAFAGGKRIRTRYPIFNGEDLPIQSSLVGDRWTKSVKANFPQLLEFNSKSLMVSRRPTAGAP